MQHLSEAQRLAAGLRALPGTAQPFAAAQAAWRFFSNPSINLPQLAAPLIEAAKSGVGERCDEWALVAFDWSLLHFGNHESKTDRVALAHNSDLGYELLTALAISDRLGEPLAPVCLELRSGTGVHSTRHSTPQSAAAPLDGLEPVMSHIDGLDLGRRMVYIIDREADSVGHYRAWSASRRHFIVRANDARRVLTNNGAQKLGDVAGHVPLSFARVIQMRGAAAEQWIGETSVILNRPARTHRVVSGRKVHRNVSGEPLELRLIVSQVRDESGAVLAQWLLLSNLPPSVSAATIALWYYWRWRIESYHKLLKGAGQQVESWLQDDAEQLARRLAVAAMACVVVWQIARAEGAQAAEMRNVLVRLSGRLMKRGKTQRGFTEPALLAGMGTLLAVLSILEDYSVDELKKLISAVLPSSLCREFHSSG